MGLRQRMQNLMEERRIGGLVRPHTMAGRKRVKNLYRLAQRIEAEQIPGDVIECGVFNGGTAAVLARTATRSQMGRTVWLFDSFKGLPEATEHDGPGAEEYVGTLRASPERVKDVLRQVGADLGRVRIVEGFFAETFPTVEIPRIALLNIDADFYESVKLCLEKFYDRVVANGFVSLDDYGDWPGCRKAVDEFFKVRGLSYPLRRVDHTARWFQKT